MAIAELAEMDAAMVERAVVAAVDMREQAVLQSAAMHFLLPSNLAPRWRPPWMKP